MIACSSLPAAPAASHCVRPTYDWPIIPTRPVDHGCRAAQATVSAPSSASAANGVNESPESNRPRVSWTTTAKPSRASRRMSAGRFASADSLRSYGVRCRSTGNGSRRSGRYTSATSSTPSRIGIETAVSTTIRATGLPDA